MHELGIAHGILDVARQYVSDHEAERVQTVRVRVGRLAGVVPESLEFCFSAIVAGTSWRNARLEIQHVAATAVCRSCTGGFVIEGSAFRCPSCGSPSLAVMSGSELHVVDLELAEAAEAS